MGMQMAPYAVWTGFRRCKPML